MLFHDRETGIEIVNISIHDRCDDHLELSVYFRTEPCGKIEDLPFAIEHEMKSIGIRNNWVDQFSEDNCLALAWGIPQCLMWNWEWTGGVEKDSEMHWWKFSS